MTETRSHRGDGADATGERRLAKGVVAPGHYRAHDALGRGWSLEPQDFDPQISAGLDPGGCIERGFQTVDSAFFRKDVVQD